MSLLKYWFYTNFMRYLFKFETCNSEQYVQYSHSLNYEQTSTVLDNSIF